MTFLLCSENKRWTKPKEAKYMLNNDVPILQKLTHVFVLLYSNDPGLLFTQMGHRFLTHSGTSLIPGCEIKTEYQFLPVWSLG